MNKDKCNGHSANQPRLIRDLCLLTYPKIHYSQFTIHNFQQLPYSNQNPKDLNSDQHKIVRDLKKQKTKTKSKSDQSVVDEKRPFVACEGLLEHTREQ